MKNKVIQGLFLAAACTLGLQIKALGPEILDQVAQQEREELKSKILEYKHTLKCKKVMMAASGALTMAASGAYLLKSINDGSLSATDWKKTAQITLKLGLTTGYFGFGLLTLAGVMESLIREKNDLTSEELDQLTSLELKKKVQKAWWQQRGQDSLAMITGGVATMYGSAGYFLYSLLDENLGLASIPQLVATAGVGVAGGLTTLYGILKQ